MLHSEFEDLTEDGRKRLINPRHHHLLPAYERSKNQPDGPPNPQPHLIHSLPRKDSGIYSPTPPE